MDNRELDAREMEQVNGGNAVLTGPEDYLRKMQGKYGGEDEDDILPRCTQQERAHFNELVYARRQYKQYMEAHGSLR